ncbi:MAG: response regulator [Deltaproteobacteria bacterium]|nr:response regulator [Deltaproteobacteria bacterium]MBW2308763.1 response regulator [Deltaproteobacteria bacterium]
MARPEEKTVLVVDDEPEIVFFLKVALKDHGFNVLTAFNGIEAMEKMREQTPDIISLDLVMPGKSGIRFFHELRKNKKWADIPVLFVTGHAHDTLDGSNLMEMLESRTISGPATYLEKPVNAETFIRNVKAILNIETAPDEHQEQEKKSLQQEVESLLQNANPEDLRDVLRILRESKH